MCILVFLLHFCPYDQNRSSCVIKTSFLRHVIVCVKQNISYTFILGFGRKILAFLIGLVIRLVLMVVLPWALDDGNLLHRVKYTDIDYHVYTDAAEYLRKGKSLYDQHTYRKCRPKRCRLSLNPKMYTYN